MVACDGLFQYHLVDETAKVVLAYAQRHLKRDYRTTLVRRDLPVSSSDALR
jgi:hypothetical protein